MRQVSFLVALLLVAACTRPAPDLAPIGEVLAAQTAAWNRGDLEGFMAGYQRSDSLKFVGSNGVTYGWQATLDGYRKRYPDGAARGTLRFEILSTEAVGEQSAFTVGRWFLTRPEAGDLDGHFTLLWQHLDGRWVIVADHSS
ncbi:MAG: nuclear transport factor 2 family protein [Catalinimonas sp.]